MSAEQTVQVKDADGEDLTRIVCGETKVQALQRLQSLGILENSAGTALRDTDIITTAGEPYVFKVPAYMFRPPPPPLYATYATAPSCQSFRPLPMTIVPAQLEKHSVIDVPRSEGPTPGEK
jgi:hypothetical protein